ALRRQARQEGYLIIKKGTRAAVDSGPCVGHGDHINISGRKRKGRMDNIGSLSSCELCRDTPRGPRLHKTVWRLHRKF
ncbi:MAG: hypothetical protein AAGC55_16490, partial [Myxococcota bacterium]